MPPVPTTRLGTGQLIGRSVGIVFVALFGAFLAWVIPMGAIFFAGRNEPDSGLAFLVLGVLLFLVAGSVGYLLTSWWSINRWIPKGQRSLPWLVCLLPLIIIVGGVVLTAAFI